MRFAGFSALICCLILSASTSEKLSRIRSNLSSKREALAEIERKERGLRGDLGRIDRKINIVEGIIADMEAMKSLLLDSLKFLRVKREQVSEKLSREKRLLAELAVSAYRRGKLGELEFILTGATASGRATTSDALRRARLVSIVGDYRRNKIKEYATLRLELNQVLSSTDSTLTAIRETEREHKKRHRSLILLKNQRRSELSELRRKRESYMREIRNLEESLRELERAIVRGADVIVKGRSFSALKGKLPWPVKGSIKIIRGFGLRRERTHRIVIKNSGIDIAVSPKSPVYAVCDGEVVYTSWLRGYDNVVLVKHPGGYYTVYGNLGEVKVKAGAKVKAGQLLGYTSSTGWIDGPKLHFEVRKGKREEDPLRWLTKR